MTILHNPRRVLSYFMSLDMVFILLVNEWWRIFLSWPNFKFCCGWKLWQYFQRRKSGKPPAKKQKTESDEERKARQRELDKDKWEAQLKLREERKRKEEADAYADFCGKIDLLLLDTSMSSVASSASFMSGVSEASGSKTPKRGVKRKHESTPANTSSSSMDSPDQSRISFGTSSSE